MELFHFLNPDNKTVNIMLFPIISFYFCIILENVLLFKRMVSKKSLGTQKNKTLTFIHLNENIKGTLGQFECGQPEKQWL